MIVNKIAVCLLIGLSTTLRPVAPRAMEFSIIGEGTPDAIIVASGEIVPGDDRKLHAFVSGLPSSTGLGTITLGSYGGNLVEGVRLAETIRNTGLKTMVVGTCASACFLMFAAGRERSMSQTAKIGVHSASNGDGSDGQSAQAVTTLMARMAGDLGVPASVVGKMVMTPPDRISWLTHDDLLAMRVSFVGARPDYEPGVALVPRAPPAGAPGPVLSAAYQAGRADRIAYEAWYGRLTGETKKGADYLMLVLHEGADARPFCNGIGASSDYILGCEQAKLRFGPIILRLRTEADYLRGWQGK